MMVTLVRLGLGDQAPCRGSLGLSGYRVIRLRAADRQCTWLAIRASRPVAVAFRAAVDVRRETATERLLVATSRRACWATAPAP